MKTKKDKAEQGGSLGANPSPIGTQQNPVSSPRRDQSNPVEEELRAREKFVKEQEAKNRDGKENGSGKGGG